MIDFAVIALPRSRTTWMANWLTTDQSFCYHDPMADQTSIMGLITLTSGKTYTGFSDTGVAWYGNRVNDIFPCPKIRIHRDIEDIVISLIEAGLHGQDARFMEDMLSHIDGPLYQFDDLNDIVVLREIWAHLLPKVPFDEERTKLLMSMIVNPDITKAMTHINAERIAKLAAEIRSKT